MATYDFAEIKFPGSLAINLNGISDTGVIAGSYYGNSGPRSPSGFTDVTGTYTAFNIPGYGGGSVDINSTGQTYGFGFRNIGDTAPFVGGPGSITILNVPGASPSLTTVSDINTQGQAVGGDGQHGFLYANGGYVAIDVPGASLTRPADITDQGQIAGTFFDKAGQSHGFRLTGTAYTSVDVPGATYTQLSGASADGRAFGVFTDAAGKSHGFMETASGFSAVDVPGASFTTITGISAAGQVYGYFDDASSQEHGFILTNGVYSTVDVPGATSTSVTGISAAGQIVGDFTSAQLVHGFVAAEQNVFGYLLFGTVEHNTNSAAGTVTGLFGNLLGRGPGALALEHFVYEFGAGASAQTIATEIMASPEYTAIHPAGQSNADFITSLYQNGLLRAPDAQGQAYYQGELSGGVSRATIAVQIATSAEAQSVRTSAFQIGVIVPDQAKADLARLYYGVLGRTPDANGLASFEAQVQQGGSTAGVAQTMLSSQEFSATHGNLSDSAFVDSLYVGALGHHADATATAYWTGQLAQSGRVQVAVQISESAEAQVHLVGQIEQSFHVIA